MSQNESSGVSSQYLRYWGHCVQVRTKRHFFLEKIVWLKSRSYCHILTTSTPLYHLTVKTLCFKIIFSFLGFLFIAFSFFFFFIYFYQLEANYFTTLQWVLSYSDMNQPWSYMYSPSRSPHPPPSPPNSSGSSQCTRPKHIQF